MAKHKENKVLYWIPRIASIVLILFLALFSLDIFDMDLGFWGTILGLFMHNLPSIILTGLLIVAWKYEIVGGIAFTLAGLLYVLFVFFAIQEDLPWYIALSWCAIIAVPSIAIGMLWLVNWFRKRK